MNLITAYASFLSNCLLASGPNTFFLFLLQYLYLTIRITKSFVWLVIYFPLANGYIFTKPKNISTLSFRSSGAGVVNN